MTKWIGAAAMSFALAAIYFRGVIYLFERQARSLVEADDW